MAPSPAGALSSSSSAPPNGGRIYSGAGRRSSNSRLEGQPIRHYLGLVHGETILGANTFRDILASIRDLIGGRARSYEVTLERAREMAQQELGRRARLLGADAVVGVRVEC
jgi:uncharacterized protein YbjQ (UPF0145 family)